MAHVKIWMQYFFGICLLLFSLFMYSDSFLGGLLMMLAAIVCIPTTRIYLEKLFNIQLHKQFKYAMVVFGYLAIGIFGKPKPSSNTNQIKDLQESEAIPLSISNKISPNNEIKDEIKANNKTEQKSPKVRRYNQDGNALNPNQLHPILETEADQNEIVNKEPLLSKSRASKRANKQIGESKLTNIVPQQKTYKPKVYKQAVARPRKHNQSNNRQYIRGPRGGCYYINSNGNKTYVDHSFCN
jgi:hypothetical protein